MNYSGLTIDPFAAKAIHESYSRERWRFDAANQYRAVADARERAENRPNARLVSEHWLEGGELKSRPVNIPVHVDDDLARYLWRDQRRARRRKLDAWDLHFGPTVYLLAAAVVGLVMIFGYVLISSIWGQL